MLNRYIAVPSNSAWSYDATVKPRKDIGNFCRPLGYTPVVLPMFGQSLDNMENTLSSIELNSVVILQVPTYNSFETNSRIFNSIKDKNCKVVLWVHDIDYLRGLVSNAQDDLQWLEKADVLVVSSVKIKNWIKDHLNNSNIKYVVQEVFDYDVSENDNTNGFPEVTASMVYAGNLTSKKSEFLKDINTFLDVYGDPDDKIRGVLQDNPYLFYKGKFPSQVLPSIIDRYSMGLVWDGTPDSRYQKYQEYNWSHKASLYLASKLFIVAKAGTNVGEYAKKHGIGATVESLNDLDTVSVSSFAKVKEYQARVKSGYYTYKTIVDINNILSE